MKHYKVGITELIQKLQASIDEINDGRLISEVVLDREKTGKLEFYRAGHEDGYMSASYQALSSLRKVLEECSCGVFEFGGSIDLPPLEVHKEDQNATRQSKYRIMD